MDLDIDKIGEYKNKLEKCEDMLPLILMTYIESYKYINNLKKKDLWYGNVQDKIFKRRMKTMFLNTEDSILFEEKELATWLKKNKDYEDIILIS